MTDIGSSESSVATALSAIREAVSVATLLRTLGAAAMVASISVFLMQGFDVEGDLNRVFMLLGQSGLLAVAGLLVGFALKEPKGARVFLSLCLVSVPANFAVLGAMIYSIAPLDGGLLIERYPEFARWQAASLKDVAMAVTAGLALLVPTTAFAFTVLARRVAVPLSLGLIGGSAALLLPVRDPAIIAGVAGLLTMAVIALIVRLRKRLDVVARPLTFEERLANALLFIAPGIMLGRSAMVHGIDEISALPLAGAAYFLLYRLTRRVHGTVKRQMFVATLASAAAVASSALAVSAASAFGLLPTFSPGPVFLSILAALLYPLAARSDQESTRRVVGASWTALAVVTVIVGMFDGPSLIILASNLLVAGAITAFGVVTARTGRTVIGMISIVFTVLPYVEDLVPMLRDTGWFGLAALGVTTIVAGSLLERFGPAMRLRFARPDTEGPSSAEHAEGTAETMLEATVKSSADRSEIQSLAA